MDTQEEIFAGHEADNWFGRNRDAIEHRDMETDFPIRLLDFYGIGPRSAIEIGASNGYRMEALRARYGSRVTAVELSGAAIESGRERYPGVDFVRGSAAHIPTETKFDLVVVNFVMHWVDRINLLRSVAELDRITGDGGFLLIGDFAPALPTRVPYHHLPDQQVFTFKQNYASIFIATGLYNIVCCLTGNGHSGVLDPGVSDSERTAHWLLRKNASGSYVTGELPRPQALP